MRRLPVAATFSSRRHRVLVLGVLVILGARLAGAVDTTTFICEDKVGVAAGVRWGARRGKCLASCQRKAVEGDPRVCANPPGLDAETLACVGKADERFRADGLKFCPSTMPACYGSLDPVTYVNAQIAVRAPLIDGSTVPLLMCDPTAIECEGLVVRRLNVLARTLTRCLGRCYRVVQLHGAQGRQCTPDLEGDPFDTLDGTTQACVRRAITRTEAAIMRECQPLPACGLYPGGISAVLDIIVSNIVVPYANPNSNPYCAP